MQEDAQTLIQQLNYAEAPRPFKNPAYAKTTSNRRTKSAKQVIQIERERYIKPKKKQRTAASQAATTVATSVDGIEDDEEAVILPETSEEVVRKEQYIACESTMVCAC